jgi:hypothetical protein
MAAKSIFNKPKLSKAQLWLLVILLAFVLLLVFIWLWYNLELRRIDKQLKTTNTSATFIYINNTRALAQANAKQLPHYFITHKNTIPCQTII